MVLIDREQFYMIITKTVCVFVRVFSNSIEEFQFGWVISLTQGNFNYNILASSCNISI